MHIIVSGEVLIVAIAEDGTGVPIRPARHDEHVGEMAIISNEMRAASLVASGEVRVSCISQSDFEEILHTRPDTSLAVMRWLCERLRDSIASQAVAYHAESASET